MARFHIDDSEIDVAELEARVLAAIEEKLGSRFSEEELARLRTAELEPPLRREDLPRGLPAEIAEARPRLPEIGGSPPPQAVARERPELDRKPPAEPRISANVYVPAPGGALRGRVKRLFGALMRRFYKATLNLESVLDELESRQERMVDELAQRDDRYFDHLESRLEHTADQLKDNLDVRIDRTSDWVGAHLSDMTGRLDRSAERQLLLLHNLVYELTNARLDLMHMQHRINETGQRLARLEQRERALEKLALEPPGGD